MPNVRGGRRGDLLVEVLVETPKSLTKRQEELFRELAEIEHKHVSPERKGFLDKVRDFFGAGDSNSEAG
jgi:molecular chaperone DnaJ